MMPHVIRNENPAYYDPESTLVIDSKGLFEALDNDLPQDDWTSALEDIERKSITQYEKICLSVCRRRQCPIEQGDPLEIDRGNLASSETRKHR